MQMLPSSTKGLSRYQHGVEFTLHTMDGEAYPIRYDRAEALAAALQTQEGGFVRVVTDIGPVLLNVKTISKIVPDESRARRIMSLTHGHDRRYVDANLSRDGHEATTDGEWAYFSQLTNGEN